MRASARGVSSLLFCGLIVCLAWSAPAKSADGAIKLRVPVELKKMIAGGVWVTCSIRGDAGSLGFAKKLFPIANGEFDQIVELIVQPKPGKSFVAAKTYRCSFSLMREKGDDLGTGWAAKQGPPGLERDLWTMARPGEFFRTEVTGELTGPAFGAGPKSLQSK